MNTFTLPFVVVALVIVFVGSTTFIKAQDFSYVVGSPNSPDRWGYLNTTWAACKFGTNQSPIDLPSIPRERPPSSRRIRFSYNSGNATVENRGHAIEVKWEEDVSEIKTDDVEYILKQGHWHIPSEHTISGTRYAMEFHLVHQNPNAVNTNAVVALLYTIGSPDPFLAQLMDEIIAIAGTQNEVDAGMVNPSQAIGQRGIKTYYRYKGSLTTPPCSEDVLWTVDTQIRTVSQDQIDLLRQAVNDVSTGNARPLQDRNNRPIHLYVQDH